MLGTRLDSTKELVVIADGYQEPEESWAELLRDLKKRDMKPPVLAVGDGALGFWAAARDVFPETRHQRNWVHAIQTQTKIRQGRRTLRVPRRAMHRDDTAYLQGVLPNNNALYQ
jgi:transposase-like protein